MTDELPSFSLILETANLELADLAGLRESLESIAQQDIDIGRAHEVLMVESGDVPPNRLDAVATDYPWLDIIEVSLGTGYEEAKMEGVKRCRGEIVVFFDSDCRYERKWLRGLLEGLAEHPDIGVLGGETMIRADSAIGLATSVLFTFNFYSGRESIYEHKRIHLNNAAFRRKVLEEHPFPVGLPVFRMSSSLYVDGLRQAGIRVARQPKSRVLHSPPNGLGLFLWRFIMFGHDAVNVYRMADAEIQKSTGVTPRRGLFVTRMFSLIADRGVKIFSRLGWLLRDDSRHWLRLPIALPLIVVGGFLMLVGYVVTLLVPSFLPSIMPESIKRGAEYAHPK